MAVADELMLDRLSQICQEVIGKFGKLQSLGHNIQRLTLSSDYQECVPALERYRSLLRDRLQGRRS